MRTAPISERVGVTMGVTKICKNHTSPAHAVFHEVFDPPLPTN